MSDQIKCPECNTEVEETVEEGMPVKCRLCGSVFLYAPKITKVKIVKKEEKTPDPKQKKVDTVAAQPTQPNNTEFQKVIKCPHCDKFIILNIPVVISTDIQGMSKNPAEKCPKCKGKKTIHEPGPGDGYDVACDKCNGIGAIPIEKKQDEKK